MYRCFLLIVTLPAFANAASPTLDAHLKAVNSVGNVGLGHPDAIAAWAAISREPVESLPAILGAIEDEKPLAANWIRAAVDHIAERAIQRGRKLPAGSLEAFIFNLDHSPRARRLAYEWLATVDADAPARIIPRMLNDPSVELRRDAVAQVLDRAESRETKERQREDYRLALSSARDTDQIEKAYEVLVELGETVDLARHFGFIRKWKLIGPFDNTNKGGFDVVYPPEKELKFDRKYTGKLGQVAWIDHVTRDQYGMVNLNEAIGKNMGSAGYAAAAFESSQQREVDLRLGCINAAKVWLNGEPIMAHEVYHANTKIDQYVARGTLKRGRNSILLKICQNEQTDAWAQDWQFQFRVCDRVGTAVLSDDRSRAD